MPYGCVKWDEFASDTDPLELLLSRGISVYFKFSRELYFARTKAARSARLHPPVPLQDSRPDFVAWRSDYEVSLLQLSEENIREIIKTGACTVVTFSLGGLKLPNADAKNNLQAAVPEGSAFWRSDEVYFQACYLVDKLRWEKHFPHSKGQWINEDFVHHKIDELRLKRRLELITPEKARLTHRDFAHHPKIVTDDLYLDVRDIGMLRKEASSSVDAATPVGLSVRQWSPAIQVLFDVSVAFNSGRIPWENRKEETPSSRRYAAILEWIEAKTPKNVSRKKWKRTVKTIVPVDYNRSTKFRQNLLPELPAELQISTENLSIATYCALTIAQWWLIQGEVGEDSKYELGSLLVEVGFEETAIVDVVSMVMEIVVPHKKQDIKDFVKESVKRFTKREWRMHRQIILAEQDQ